MSAQEEDAAVSVYSSSTRKKPTPTKNTSNRQLDSNNAYNITNARKIANYLQKFKWYFPAKDQEPIEIKIPSTSSNVAIAAEDGAPRMAQPPSLNKAWEVFEKQCLPRRFANVESHRKGRKYMRAGIGVLQPTKLYPVFGTPMEDMADFGIGVGMYFKTLRYFGIVTFIAGCISIPSMMFFASEEYSTLSDYDGNTETDFFTRLYDKVDSFSAVCYNTKFQPCPSCTVDQWDNSFQEVKDHRLFFDQNDLVFILTNECRLNDLFGYITFATLMFVLLSVYFFAYLQRKNRIRLDIGEQTSIDYSIKIHNPPTTEFAKDPENWKTFFEERFEHLHVTVCTVALANEELLKLLLQKRQLKIKMRDLLPPTVEFDDNRLEDMAKHCNPPSFFQKLFCGSSANILFKKIMRIDEEVDGLLAGADFGVSDVFVTFETEEMQRVVLDTMKVPKLRRHLVDDDMKFEGTVLDFDIADEPSSIRWTSLNVSTWSNIRQQTLTFGLSCGLIVGSSILIYYAYRRNLWTGTVTIVIVNTISPFLVRLLTNMESHESETSLVTSAYIKVTLIRWVNTALVTYLITPFTDYLEVGKLTKAIRVLFTAELVQRPILQLVDWMGHLNRHALGPNAPDQRRMNLYFMSSPYSIGERLTEVTKLLLLTFIYSIFFPLGFFFASTILFVYYWMDKFCILRTWRRGPKINADISLFSTYFLWLAVLFYAVFVGVSYTSFPNDNACKTDDELPDEYFKNFRIVDGTYAGTNFTISSEDTAYKYCSQDVFMQGFKKFPPTILKFPESYEWTPPSQEWFLILFGWTLVAIIGLTIVSFFLRLFIRFIKPMFISSYAPLGKVRQETFSHVLEIYGYVPQVEISGSQYPILLCDVSDLDPGLIGWNGDFEFYNVIHNVPAYQRKSSFSQVKNWDPSEEDIDYTETIVPPPSPTRQRQPEFSNPIMTMLGSMFGRCV